MEYSKWVCVLVQPQGDAGGHSALSRGGSRQGASAGQNSLGEPRAGRKLFILRIKIFTKYVKNLTKSSGKESKEEKLEVRVKNLV